MAATSPVDPSVSRSPIPLDAESICVHGDSDGAVAMARTIRDALEREGTEVTGFLPPRS